MVPSERECMHVKIRPFITSFSEQNLEILRAAHRANLVETHVKQRRSVPRQTHLIIAGNPPLLNGRISIGQTIARACRLGGELTGDLKKQSALPWMRSSDGWVRQPPRKTSTRRNKGIPI
jgi:hypothetical protein